MTPFPTNDLEGRPMDVDRTILPFTVTIPLTHLLLMVLLSLCLGGISGAAGMYAVLLWVGC